MVFKYFKQIKQRVTLSMYSIKKYKKIVFFIILILVSVTYFSVISEAAIYRSGDREEKVEEIQQMLSYIGYDIEVDGIYGQHTENIVKKFQNNNNLSVDGIVGENTLDVLKTVSRSEIYTVQSGDSLWSISRKFDTTIEAIKNANNLNSDRLQPGQELNIPQTGKGGQRSESSRKIIHEVKRGESLSAIARRYGSSITNIKLANNLSNDRIYVGQDLVIPNKSNDGPFDISEDKLIWPVLGTITSGYGWRTHPISNDRDFHTGIDIAIPVGKEIRAAAPGKVVESDWRGGYGKTIIIDHGDGVKTLYAHNSRLVVPSGRKVNTGDVVALSGSTGVSSGPHLHFEVIINSDEVNPINYLP